MSDIFLQSKDRKFMCTAEHAVEAAYLLSMAEGAVNKSPSDKSEIGRLLVEYCFGNLTDEELLSSLEEYVEEAA